ncbi:2-succinyl-6-hydroxy-2,4-cyclohexadiene-1-carboxylate synthase [Oceanirhabdus seepicola]|uniref:Putative 2-succinyl-6-hydroxy-2,4-cyclohexadiene-1-carboxylate synthase n=1 Tax=Oceanirhabdus seepicola TaxID=2828781 RepID=A0A9J6P744_9CLOT|nr:2-succinyl-6-hydroxy-2,4-cyclohexadiene-1-carboxylate synthase [Oceanirhabdus seepicola]MCM1991777.1 2-succinyl-6-hydroxy-2,4-cyclohexadiene-1-carboxylate synthase [Oceanirhabdus seepicola]
MFIEIENIKYHIHIKGEGKPIICLHGFSENLNTWKLLELKGYKLILIDLIGHGNSDKPYSSEYYDLKVMIKHFNKLIQELGFEKYSMVGYSMGGRIALAYALSYQNEITQLILESSSYGECDFRNRLKRRNKDFELAKSIREKGIEWFNDFWSNLSIFESQKNLPENIKNDISKRRLSNETHALSNTLLYTGQGSFPCLKDEIVNLTMPVLFISGEYDKKYKEMGNEFQKLNFNVKHKTICGVGHNTHIENPDKFNKMLSEFLL